MKLLHSASGHKKEPERTAWYLLNTRDRKGEVGFIRNTPPAPKKRREARPLHRSPLRFILLPGPSRPYSYVISWAAILEAWLTYRAPPDFGGGDSWWHRQGRGCLWGARLNSLAAAIRSSQRLPDRRYVGFRQQPFRGPRP